MTGSNSSATAAALREAESHLSRVDPVLAPLIARHGPCTLAQKPRDPFHILCTSIISQQLSSKAADTIQQRVHVLLKARPHLKPGSAIINCTSVTMYKGSKELLDYSATKGAITAFTRSLSENLVKDGVRVNAVAPGPIWTPLNPMGGKPPEEMKDFGKNTPMERPGQPNEVAPSFLFLACEDSSYMSGQVLHPNGGVIVNG